MELFCQPQCLALARRYANDYGVRLAADNRVAAEGEYFLNLDDGGLSLCQGGRRAHGPIQVDFTAGGARHRRLYGGGKSQAIARAVGVRDGIRPSVADLTAGMGGDAFVLASLGCRVTMVERHPVAAALLRDGLDRALEAAGNDADLGAILDRLALERMDARHWLASRHGADVPDVIYLDPMFPERRKSAQVNKTMQAFQQLVGDDPDGDGLLAQALEVARFRVVVKRPGHAPWLGNRKPGYALEGKSVRFDIYPLKALTAG